MEISFSKLKKLDVICLSDGKNLGRFFDVVFTMPDGKIKGFFTTGCKGFKFSKQDIFIPLGDIVKIGEDAVLVKIGSKPPKKPCPPKQDNCKPECPPPNSCNPCQSPFGPPPTPFGNQYTPPFNTPENGRRNFDDYE